MKRSLIILLALAIGVGSIPASAKKAPKAKRVVMIALDGITVEGFQKANTPRLDAMLAEGALSLQTRVVMPSVTLPNWTSHLTGSGPEQHGVADNGWEPGKFKLPAVQTDADGYYPSVFQALKEQVPGVKAAFYYNWINLFYPHNKKYQDEAVYLKDDAYIPYYNQAFDFIVKHRKSPTVVFLYSVHTDHAGHNHSWASDEYIQSIEEADVQIGIFLDKLKKEGLYDETHFMFLSDHGGVKTGHGGLSEAEMIVPWGITGPGIKNGFTITEPNNTVNTAAVIMHLFRGKCPLPWVGEVPYSIFK